MDKLHRVFVYGTLKRGEPNHYWFTKKDSGFSKFLSEGKTIKKFPLIIATRYNIPFLLNKPGEGHNVQGELYEVCDKTLKQLDILEDHPNFYIREIEPILLSNGEKFDAWVYLLKTFKPELLQNQMFESYSSRGSHGLKYMERYLRDEQIDYKTEVVK